MKKKFVFIFSAIILCLLFALSACNETGGGNNNDRDDTYYTVTFDSQGGSAVESQRVLAGNPVTAPDSPTRANFDFGGWFRSTSEDAARWNFATDRVNENLTLYARWTAKEEPPAPSETLTFEQNGDGYVVTGDSGHAANIVIPESHEELPVVGIADSAFAYSRHTSDIISVTIPDSVIEIGKNAFHNQDALVSVNIGTDSKLRKIGNNAFSGNSSLVSIYLPAGFSELGDDVFNNCGGLNEIAVASGNTHYSGAGNCLIDIETNTLIRGSNNSAIPETVERIGAAAFRRATMTVLTIPKSVTFIDRYAISDSAISKIVYEGTSADWENIEKAFSRYWNMGKESVTIVCSDTEETAHILVAYFSCTNRTKGIAEKIAEVTDGELYEIEPEQPYTDEDLNYGDSGSRATAEQRDPQARPAISGQVEDMESYATVFLGYPIWWGTAPKIIFTFLESYDLSDKTIVPFCTSGSSGIASSVTDLKRLETGADWRSGRRFEANASKSEVEEWIRSLDLVIPDDIEEEEMAEEIYLTINDSKISVKLEKNSAVDALIEILKRGDIVFTASDYGGFEKVGDLGYSLPRSDKQTTTRSGDVVLYSGDRIVLFYGSNSWSYTKLGKVQGISEAEWKSVLTATDTITVNIGLK